MVQHDTQVGQYTVEDIVYGLAMAGATVPNLRLRLLDYGKSVELYHEDQHLVRHQVLLAHKSSRFNGTRWVLEGYTGTTTQDHLGRLSWSRAEEIIAQSAASARRRAAEFRRK